MTPPGKQAYRILAWAFDDPAGRVSTAQDRLRVLAAGITDGKAQREITDAGTMLSRLAGGTITVKSISAQVEGR